MGTQYQFLQWLGFTFCPQNFGIKYYQLRLPCFYARYFFVFTHHNFWGQLPSSPKSMPTYLKCNESVKGGVTLPIPPTHKNTTQKYLYNKRETTPAICSRRRRSRCRCHCRCRCCRHRRHHRILCQEPPPPSLPASPPSPSLASSPASLPPSSPLLTSSPTSSPTLLPTVVRHRLPPSSPRSSLTATTAAVHHLPPE